MYKHSVNIPDRAREIAKLDGRGVSDERQQFCFPSWLPNSMKQTSRQLLLRFWLEVAIFCWQFCEAQSLEQLKDQLCFLEQIEILRPMLNAKGNVRNVECVLVFGCSCSLQGFLMIKDQTDCRFSMISDMIRNGRSFGNFIAKSSKG